MKKMMVSLFVAVAFFGACSKSSTNPGGYTPDCSGTAKSFKTDVSPLIQSACAGCHSNYSGYSGITSDKAAIRSKVIDGSMPPSGSLSTTQKNIIVCWIDNGAPNN
jgi:hypothetical protein